MTGEDDRRDADLEEQLRAAFQATRVPPAPPAVRERVTGLAASPSARARQARWRRPNAAWLAPVAVVVAVALMGAAILAGGQPAPTSSPGPTTSAPPVVGDLFLRGQPISGDGWRLIAGRARLRRDPTTIMAQGGSRIELFSGEGLVKPAELLDFPKDALSVDAATESLLVVDLLVGDGPICGQIRFDGVTFDATQRRVTARYTTGLLVAPLPTGPPVFACDAIGIPAAFVVAIARDHLLPGLLTLRLERADGSGGWTPETEQTITAPVVPAPITGAALADAAGSFAGGVWATNGSTLYLSTDGGAYWNATTLLARGSPFVLDARHAWIASAGPGSTPPTGSPDDVLRFVVDRTSDGGQSWARSSVPGSYPQTTPVLAFGDAAHGYLLAAGMRFGRGSTVLRTDDGGTTWDTVASMSTNLGSNFGLGPAGSLWAGTQGDAGPVERPVLDVSRDGGRTWADARLPGLIGSVDASIQVLGAPTFVGSSGVVAVSVPGSAESVVRFYATTDGGGSWNLAASLKAPGNGSTAASVIDPSHWVTVGPDPDSLRMTSDAGQTWSTITTSGLYGEPISWLGFTDPTHGAALIPLGDSPAPSGLFVTFDGGATWQPASFPG